MLPPMSGRFRAQDAMAHFPRLSIAAKLYAIFALLATVTVVLALVAVFATGGAGALTADLAAVWLGIFAASAALHGTAALFLRRAVVRPLAAIAGVTEQVAEGEAISVPYGARRDEIGALSRSISVFQHAMLHNKELNRSMAEETAARQRRQETLSSEVAAFTRSFESNIAELGAISEQMLTSAGHLSEAADRASRR